MDTNWIVEGSKTLKARELHAFVAGFGLTLLAWWTPKASGILWSAVAGIALAIFSAKKMPIENKLTRQIEKEPHYYLAGVAAAVLVSLLLTV